MFIEPLSNIRHSLRKIIDIEAPWLGAQQPQQSFSTGCRIRIKEAPVHFALGCGEDWTLITLTEEQALCATSERHYHVTHHPILSNDIDPDLELFPDEIKTLPPYLLELVEAAGSYKWHLSKKLNTPPTFKKAQQKP